MIAAPVNVLLLQSQDEDLDDGAGAEEFSGLEDVEDNAEVYLTEAYRDWEKLYLCRLAKRIHKLVCAELSGPEEAIFVLFLSHDANLDGMLFGDEALKLMKALEQAAPGFSSTGGENGPMDKDGSISFVSLLRWYAGRSVDLDEHAANRMGFSVASLVVGVVGSSALFNDTRLDALGWAGLRRNIIGYRRLLLQLRQLQEERALEPARNVESSEGLEAALPLYHAVLVREFEGDAEHLFELFIEVDQSCNMLLETEEVLLLLGLLDQNASEADLRRYLIEINLTEGPLSFASFLDWWDQACSVSNSLVAEKGALLLASVKANSMGKKIAGLFMQTAVQQYYARAKEKGRLEVLRMAFCRALAEVRQYKMGRDLRLVEGECALP